MKDPIVDEVRRIRQEYSKQFNYDLQAIAADLQQKEKQHKEQIISFPPRPARRSKTA